MFCIPGQLFELLGECLVIKVEFFVWKNLEVSLEFAKSLVEGKLFPVKKSPHQCLISFLNPGLVQVEMCNNLTFVTAVTCTSSAELPPPGRTRWQEWCVALLGSGGTRCWPPGPPAGAAWLAGVSGTPAAVVSPVLRTTATAPSRRGRAPRERDTQSQRAGG